MREKEQVRERKEREGAEPNHSPLDVVPLPSISFSRKKKKKSSHKNRCKQLKKKQQNKKEKRYVTIGKKKKSFEQVVSVCSQRVYNTIISLSPPPSPGGCSLA